jgi:hypothetical protein
VLSEAAEALTQVLLEEADAIDDLVDAVVEQRETINSGDPISLQDQMRVIQELFFRVRTQEAQRARLARSLAEELGCEARLSLLSEALPEANRALFRGAGDRFSHSVFALKAEMAILSGLIGHNERFSTMLLSEWRRLDSGFTPSGGLDFKG